MGESFKFEKAVRSNVGLFIGLAGGTGSGKTYSAMRIAKGIVGPKKRFAVIDTENKRSLHYADEFDFEVVHLEAPFSSERYEGAVKTAFDGGYGAIVVDSASHEHDGYGGYLDAQSTDLDERVRRFMARNQGGDEYKIREKLTPSSWVQPKLHRKRMMQTLLACSSTVPVIFCFRAEEKVFASKDGKLVARPVPEWEPICGKGMPFEMTVFFMLHNSKPGFIGTVIKLPKIHQPMFPKDKLLNEDSGRLIAEWAKGGIAKPAENQTEQSEILTPDNKAKKRLEYLIGQEGFDREDFKAWLYSMKLIGLKDGKPSISTMTEGCAKGLAEKWDDAKKRFNSYIDTKNAAN